MDIKTIDIPHLLGEPSAFPLSGTITQQLEYVECRDQALELELAQRERQMNHYATVAARPDIWERCWQDRLREFRLTGDADRLLPDFLSDPKPPLRYMGKYILPAHKGLLYAVQRAILSHLIGKWMRGDTLMEFGCGSGYNLMLAQQLLDRESLLYGMDWSPAAIQCVNTLGFCGRVFDMRNPVAPDLPMYWNDTTVLTAGAMEQLGTDWQTFLGFLLEYRPQMCIHVEPLLELYDLDDPMDAEAARYHTARGYLSGFLPALQQLQREGRAQICELHRTHFGARFNDGFSWVVWRPV